MQTWLSLMLIGTLLSFLSAGFSRLIGLSPEQREILLKHPATLNPRLDVLVKGKLFF
jgi:hypothetical protein